MRGYPIYTTVRPLYFSLLPPPPKKNNGICVLIRKCSCYYDLLGGGAVNAHRPLLPMSSQAERLDVIAITELTWVESVCCEDELLC